MYVESKRDLKIETRRAHAKHALTWANPTKSEGRIVFDVFA